MLEKILKAWLWLGAGLLLTSMAAVLLRQPRPLTEFFFVFQDLPVLSAILALVVALRLTPGLSGRVGRRFSAISASPAYRRLEAPGTAPRLVFCLAALSAIVGWAGFMLVYDSYPLSLDEFMATFGAAIHSRGALMAPVADQWQDYVSALQPQFAFSTDDGAYWASAYLPVNAALRGLARAAGGEALTSPLLAAISMAAVWGVGRRMWPERPSMALIAAALLATSSQFLVTAMTPYAMNAHLAFNLVWLWLFLRGGRLGHAGALAIGFLACGLHQLLFHPLFVAPFVLQLWLERRWRLAGLYTLAYGAFCLFWIDYWPIALWAVGEAPASASVAPAASATEGFLAHALDLAAAFDPAAIGLMAQNLIRFATWQNLLTAPLAALGLLAAFRAKGTPRSLALGLMLTILAMLVLIPYQGHGWGYRYLHGLLGSVCLLAAWAWTRLTEPLGSDDKAIARVGFAVTAALSLLVLLPIRAWQAHRLVHPYALAHAAIDRAGAQLVLVDDKGSWFTTDLVRNDPYLSNHPIILSLGDLETGQASELCARYTISIFDAASAASFGIRNVHPLPRDPAREAIKAMRCGPPAATVREIINGEGPIRPS
jgi:hypothetical protein